MSRGFIQGISPHLGLRRIGCSEALALQQLDATGANDK
jgi:hypothetical protein